MPSFFHSTKCLCDLSTQQLSFFPGVYSVLLYIPTISNPFSYWQSQKRISVLVGSQSLRRKRCLSGFDISEWALSCSQLKNNLGVTRQATSSKKIASYFFLASERYYSVPHTGKFYEEDSWQRGFVICGVQPQHSKAQHIRLGFRLRQRV